MYASSWFLTLYTTALNLNLICCRIMDVFLSEGMEMIFKIALALLTIGKETVLSLDMEAMLKVRYRMCAKSVPLITVVFSISKKNCQERLKATLRDSSTSPTPSKSIRRR